MSDSIVALLCLGFLGGVIVATVIIGLIISGNKEQSDRNRSIDVCVSCGDRDRCEYNGHHQRVEEKIIVLQTIRAAGSSYEKEVIDAIVGDYERSME